MFLQRFVSMLPCGVFLSWVGGMVGAFVSRVSSAFLVVCSVSFAPSVPCSSLVSVLWGGSPATVLRLGLVCLVPAWRASVNQGFLGPLGLSF